MKPIVTAHSGAFNTPDNSMEFVEYSLSQNVEAIEVDVRLNNENILVLSHDELSGEGQETLKAVFQKISTSSVLVNCDLKESDLEIPVYTLAKEYNILDRLIFSGTVDIGRYMTINDNRTRVFLNIEEYIPNLEEKCKKDFAFAAASMEKMCRICKESGIRYININYLLAKPHIIDIARANKMSLSLWTVNNKEDFLKFYNTDGIINITTKKPDLINP